MNRETPWKAIAVLLALSVLPLRFPSPAAAAEKICYVKKDRVLEEPYQTGASWSYAFDNVNDCLTDNTVTQVWVARGTYNEIVLLTDYDDGTNRRFPTALSLYGHFAGTESAVGQRNLRNPADETVLRCPDGMDNSVVRIETNYAPARIDGFTLRNGKGTDVNFNGERHGGGIYLKGTGTIINNHVDGNTATRGGGIATYEQGLYPPPYPKHSIRVVRNRISNNTASLGGGFFSPGRRLLANNLIDHNEGGGIQDSIGVTTANTIVFNHKTTYGAGMMVYYGMDYYSSYLDEKGYITNNVIAWNVSDGEAEWGPGSAIYIQGTATNVMPIRNNVVFGNTCGGYHRIYGYDVCSDNNLVGVDPWLDNNFRLLDGSPAIDMGNPDFSWDNQLLVDWLPGDYADLDGGPRVTGAAIDIGADEFDADTVAPTVLSTVPASGATGVSRTDNVLVTFSEGIREGANWGQIAFRYTYRGKFVTVYPATSYSGALLVLHPTSALPAGTLITVSLPAGCVEDSAGNPFAGSSFTFTTGK